MTLVLNIYDKKGKKVERQATGEMCDIMFGTIEEIMGILQIDSAESNAEIFKKVAGAYKEIRSVLETIFGDISEEEWKRVKLKEILPTILSIISYSFSEMQGIPVDSKN